MYYTAFYAPGENSTEDTAKAFNPQKHILLMGGQYDKQNLVPKLPDEMRKKIQPEPFYNKGLMVYNGNGYPIQMPCGDLRVKEDPDFESIF